MSANEHRQQRAQTPANCVTAACLAVLAGCAAGNLGDDAGTRVEARGDILTFSWDANHPWSPQLSGVSSRYALIAQYRADGRAVEQNLGSPRAQGSQAWQFSLPAELRATPDSAVCLFISSSKPGASAIPVRTVAPNGGDTARFRYPDWEKQVRAATAARTSGVMLQTLQTRLAEIKDARARVLRGLEEQNVKAIGDCQNLAAQPTAPALLQTPPPGVVPLTQQRQSAERLCVRRARNMKRLKPEWRVDVEILAERALTESTTPMTERVRQQSRRFLSHWSQWRDSTGPAYSPVLGEPDDPLPLAGMLLAAMQRWNSTPAPQPPAALAALTAGLMEAYDGCLEDSQKQLADRRDAWERAQSNRPQRDRVFADRQREECVSRWHSLEALDREIAQEENEVKRHQTGTLASTPNSLPALDARPQKLNGSTCLL